MKGLQVNQFTLESQLGEGGMAEVWRAYDASRNLYAAVKFLQPQWADNPQIAERFVLEAGRQTKLHHPHIVSAFDFVYVAGHPYLLMPYIDGESLDHILFQMQGPVPLENALPICADVLGALQYAHEQNIVHRDVKPSNIMLDREGGAYVLDFGIALAQGERRLTQAGRAVGTPHYMSPEQILASPNIDGRSDIYSFGCVLYQMLTHAYVFDAGETGGDVSYLVKNKHLSEAPRPPREWNPAIPEHIEAAILRCLEKDPAKRFDSCADLLAALTDPEWRNRRPAPPPVPAPVSAPIPVPISVAVPLTEPPPIPLPIPPQPYPPTVAMQAPPARHSRLVVIAGGFTLGVLLLAGGFVAREVLTSRSDIEIPRPSKSSTVVTPSVSQPPVIRPSPMPPVDQPTPQKASPPPAPVQPPISRPLVPAPAAPKQEQRTPQQPVTPPKSAPIVPPAPIVKPTPSAPGKYAGVRTGVLVWSGILVKDEVVEIIGLRASSGTVRGNPLPGVPVQLLLRTEAITVTGTPTSVNRYSTIRFRSETRGPATIAIEWKVMPQY